MIQFSELRTSRLVVSFKASSIADSIRICGIPTHEISVGEFLRAVVTDASIPLNQWTVSERTYAIIHYIGHISEEGADFSIGKGRVTDYIHYDEWSEAPDTVTRINNNDWRVIHFLGRYAESIERTEGHISAPKELHWLAGEMAARLRNESDTEEVDDTIIDDWMIKRIKYFLSLPDDVFYELSDFMGEQNEHMIHLLNTVVSYQGGGINCLPRQEDGSELLAPATFPCATCINPRTRNLQKIFDQLSRQSIGNV